jgi:hypothetical protein
VFESAGWRGKLNRMHEPIRDAFRPRPLSCGVLAEPKAVALAGYAARTGDGLVLLVADFLFSYARFSPANEVINESSTVIR